jgi:hypothetical protein
MLHIANASHSEGSCGSGQERARGPFVQSPFLSRDLAIFSSIARSTRVL